MTEDRPGFYMETFTGKRFYVLDPRPEDICIEDIAHSLANTVRYRGHCRHWYSVAEHSVHVANIAAGFRGVAEKSASEILEALLHDAPETYTGDMPTPVKLSIPGLVEAEDKIDRVIRKKYGLPAEKSAWLKQIDTRIVVDERKAVMRPTENVWGVDHLQPYNIAIQGWQPAEAEWKFLSLFRSLTLDRQVQRRVHVGGTVYQRCALCRNRHPLDECPQERTNVHTAQSTGR